MGKQSNAEEFIAKAQALHGEKYNYSQVAYQTSSSKVIIICPEHGAFEQIPSSHLWGRGCRVCAGTIKLTTTEFIAKARAIHGNKYDYSQVEYTSNKDKVEIICPKHGAFTQKPNGHLDGKGCDTCRRKLITTEEFIARAQAVHGDKYDYSQTVYINRVTKVNIICPEHGLFEQESNGHLRGRGCAACAIINKRTTEADFIKRSCSLHGNKYDYSQVVYQNNSSKVLIICPEHGAFEQTPNGHLGGQGCRKCAGTAKLTTAEFIAKAQEVHDNKYDYSQVVYKSALAKVTIICPEHGAFTQQATAHTFGNGCRLCGITSAAKKKHLGKEIFLARARAAHENKYDYSQVVYTLGVNKVDIICPEHGVFSQTPDSHIKGVGCPACSLLNRPSQIKSLEAFIADAQAVHGEKFDYSLVDYQRASVKVEIICPIHGVFKQTPANHLTGYGCRACGWITGRSSWIEMVGNRESTLYLLRIFSEEEEFYKVGITTHSVKERFRQKHRMPYQYEVLAEYKSTNAGAVYDWEKSILETFAHLAYKPKLYFEGQTECFSECDEILACFPI
ncbi:GIY-YIG nuclease family protein [Hymenobacter fodinae]|uniref:Bacteriophage T5 Orf172 DNA-binding domain-containing protein n=1 Tax=Hymenobacter fodinae TaxID=2510796 RepID=A0A4Z0P8K8_9BACT|nr:GIY-YIG nuclease family protein [Hymenobacter fodinae]TGE07716.1 hypothetical protein EU556_08150 [Hymenobacter fodinae]